MLFFVSQEFVHEKPINWGDSVQNSEEKIYHIKKIDLWGLIKIDLKIRRQKR